METRQKRAFKILPVFLSGYSCRFGCVYCNASGTSGEIKVPNVRDLERKVRNFLSEHSNSPVEIALYGNDPSSLEPTIWQEILLNITSYCNEHPDAGIRVSVRPDTIVEMGSLANTGIRVVELGVPSMDPHVLKKICREHTPDTVEAAVKILKREKITTGIQTMLGLPEADALEAMTTAVSIIGLAPDFVRIHPTLVLKATALERMFVEREYTPWTLEQAVVVSADCVVQYRSAGIPVARCGFHIPEDLREDVLVAGPYHPAFGSLVNSEIRYRELRTKLLENPTIRVLTVPDEFISDYVGHGRSNIHRLRREFGHDLVITAEKKHPAKGCSAGC